MKPNRLFGWLNLSYCSKARIPKSLQVRYTPAAMDTIDFIPLVKAYPALSRTYGEVSCVAGVEMTADGPRWMRFYPVPFRSLEDDKQFRKYQPVRVRAAGTVAICGPRRGAQTWIRSSCVAIPSPLRKLGHCDGGLSSR